MARRFIGQAVIDVSFDGAYRGEQNRFYYRGRITAPGGERWSSRNFGSPAGGFGPGVAADSAEAYDRIAVSVAQFASYYTTGNRKNADEDGDTKGYPTAEQADAFHDAIVEAMGDDKGRLEVRRRKDGPVALID